MPNQHIQLKRFGERAILLEWPANIQRDISQEILAVHEFVLNQKDWGILEAIPAYHSLLVEFDPAVIKLDILEEKLLASITQLEKKNRPGKLWEIPVQYNGEDVLSFCASKKMSIEQMIQLHSSPEYYVYFIGFLPGFLYLGELAKELHLPRRSSPRAQVPQGAVAIGGQQTGIYPQASPGGWHIIGQTDFTWFSAQHNPPTKIFPGDRIKFIPQ